MAGNLLADTDVVGSALDHPRFPQSFRHRSKRGVVYRMKKGILGRLEGLRRATGNVFVRSGSLVHLSGDSAAGLSSRSCSWLD